MEFHMIYIAYAALHMRALTEKTTFSCKDDCTLTKHTGRWTYSARDCEISLCHILPLQSFFQSLLLFLTTQYILPSFCYCLRYQKYCVEVLMVCGNICHSLCTVHISIIVDQDQQVSDSTPQKAVFTKCQDTIFQKESNIKSQISIFRKYQYIINFQKVSNIKSQISIFSKKSCISYLQNSKSQKL